MIANNEDLSLLIVRGKVDKEFLAARWELIVKKNTEENGNYQFNAYFTLLKVYATLLADYNLAKGIILKMCIDPIDYELISTVRSMGYKMDITNTGTFAESLKNALNKISNYNTKLESKKKEIQTMWLTMREDKQQSSYEAVVANLNYALGFSVAGDITLAAFNEYKKIFKEHSKKKEIAYGGNK
jgi:hypothetical protein